MARLPAWAVYRRKDRDDGPHLDLVGLVLAHTQGDALTLATRLPDAPKYPVVCHASPAVKGRVALVTATDVPAVVPARRKSRRAA